MPTKCWCQNTFRAICDLGNWRTTCYWVFSRKGHPRGGIHKETISHIFNTRESGPECALCFVGGNRQANCGIPSDIPIWPAARCRPFEGRESDRPRHLKLSTCHLGKTLLSRFERAVQSIRGCKQISLDIGNNRLIQKSKYTQLQRTLTESVGEKPASLP
jgi:hypothetical protein